MNEVEEGRRLHIWNVLLSYSLCVGDMYHIFNLDRINSSYFIFVSHLHSILNDLCLLMLCRSWLLL